MYGNVVVRQVGMVDAEQNEIGRFDFRDRAIDTRDRRTESCIGGDVRVVRAYVGAEREELFGDHHRG